MVTIKAVIPSELVAQLREAAEPAEDIEETVQGAIQMTLPTAEVNFSPQVSEVTVQIPDDQMISALLGMARFTSYSTRSESAASLSLQWQLALSFNLTDAAPHPAYRGRSLPVLDVGARGAIQRTGIYHALLLRSAATTLHSHRNQQWPPRTLHCAE